jgi:hypothetical protein
VKISALVAKKNENENTDFRITNLGGEDTLKLYYSETDYLRFTHAETKEVSFTEYSLTGTSCQWTTFNNDNDEVVVINSNEELNQYVTCTDNGYPEIDFSKSTLLLARGTGTSSVVSVGCSRLQQISEQGYTMNIDLVLGNATVMSPWQVPILVDKWREGSTVELTVTIKYD